jgi:hypothetical protein
MTGKKIEGNIKAIRAGIEIKTEETLPEPLTVVVSALEDLLGLAKTGNLREISFVAINHDDTHRFGTVGEPVNFTMMAACLDVLKTDYFETITYPVLTGYYDDIDE